MSRHGTFTKMLYVRGSLTVKQTSSGSMGPAREYIKKLI